MELKHSDVYKLALLSPFREFDNNVVARRSEEYMESFQVIPALGD